MSFTILTIYRLFFVTQDDFMFALTKDGRPLKIKKIPYFPALSFDKKILSGISFDGEYTHVFSEQFNFSNESAKEVASFFGYFYYPTFDSTLKKVALIEADLLKPRPQGELCVYRKKIKKWYKLLAIDAKMKAPAFLPDDSILFIAPDSSLSMYKNDDSVVQIAQNVQFFNLSSNKENIILFDGEKIAIYNTKTFAQTLSFPMFYVTALAFNDQTKEAFYATSYEGRHAIYSFNIDKMKSELLLQTQAPVILVESNI